MSKECFFIKGSVDCATHLDDAVVWVYDGTAVERAAVGSLNGVVAPPIPTEATFGRPAINCKKFLFIFNSTIE